MTIDRFRPVLSPTLEEGNNDAMMKRSASKDKLHSSRISKNRYLRRNSLPKKELFTA